MTRADTLTVPRFVGRKEYFGSVFFDRDNHRILPFDKASTLLLWNAPCPREELHQAFRAILTAEGTDQFLSRWTEAGLLTPQGALNARLSTIPAQEDGVFTAPLRMYLNLTNACNLRCAHCVNSSGKGKPRELSMSECFKIIDRLHELTVFELKVAGGEPMLRKDLAHILQYAADKGLSVSMATNGTVLNRQMIQQLDGIPLRFIMVSFEGADPAAHDPVRGKGSFARALQGLQLIKELTHHHINLHFTLTGANCRDLEDIFRFAERSPAHSIGFTPMRPSGNGTKQSGLWLSREEYVRSIHLLAKLARTFSKPVSIPMDPEGSGGRLYTGFGCGAGNVNGGIDSEGYMAPCNFFTGNEWRGHNVREKDILDVWLNSPLFKRLRSLPGNPRCKECPHYMVCRGNCRAAALFLAGDLNAPDEHCLR